MHDCEFAGLITVRTKSSRLPKKCLMPFGDRSIIEHIIDRCRFYEIEPIICTTTHQSDDILQEISEKKRVKFFRGSEINKIKRWAECVEKFKLQCFHTIDADDPFFDGDEVKKSMNLLNEEKYDIVFPSEESSNGLASVGFSIKSEAIYKLHEEYSGNIDTEYIWEFIKDLPSLNCCILGNNNYRKIIVRLTLDYLEDYEMLNLLRQRVGNFANREVIYNELEKSPELIDINLFRNDDFLKNQRRK